MPTSQQITSIGNQGRSRRANIARAADHASASEDRAGGRSTASREAGAGPDLTPTGSFVGTTRGPSLRSMTETAATVAALAADTGGIKN
ncbi:MAG: hypothetical protein ACREHD_27305, partial [Pirellulales bacterium]